MVKLSTDSLIRIEGWDIPNFGIMSISLAVKTQICKPNTLYGIYITFNSLTSHCNRCGNVDHNPTLPKWKHKWMHLGKWNRIKNSIPGIKLQRAMLTGNKTGFGDFQRAQSFLLPVLKSWQTNVLAWIWGNYPSGISFSPMVLQIYSLPTYGQSPGAHRSI